MKENASVIKKRERDINDLKKEEEREKT